MGKDLLGRSSSSSANAEARMKFGPVDALSELVWSPRQQTNMAILHSNSTSIEEAGFRVVDVQLRTVVDRNEDEVNQTNRPLSGEVKHEREEMVETNDDVGTSKRSLDKEEGDKTNERVRILDRLESTDENDFATLAVTASKALVACDGKEKETDGENAGPSGSYRRREKGKGKALSDGGDDDDEESFGSVESCNSAGLLPRGKKRAGFEQGLILGSKRLKTLGDECLGSSSKLKQDSSFMNWISNMTKGIWNGNEQENHVLNTTSLANGQVNAVADQQQLSPCCLKENTERNTGFQSFFQSIYCPKKTNQDASEMELPNDTNARELPWIPVTEEDATKHEEREPNKSLLPLSKCKSDEDEKRPNISESLWISRFSSRSSFPQKKDLHTNEVAKEANGVIIPSVSKQVRLDSHNAILPIVSSLRIESSEAMASMFARRLEALKHIMPSRSLETAENGQAELICFYCGKKGHWLKDCLEVTDSELRDLVENLTARNGSEEVSSLCIRCFQLSHWAATCPNAPPYSSGAMKHTFASTSGTKLPLSDFTTKQPKAVFNAVQLLRLTRTDVLKWMNTKKSVSGLEGFFLRLRLGKWEEGIGGTGYHVARIDGVTEGESSRRHSENGSISVKVGGVTCFVESQFISNHDFLEEELKAWWSSAVKGAGRSGSSIPTEEELGQKLEQRKMLGF